MDNCALCLKRYGCRGMQQFKCEMSNYAYYEPDRSVIEETKKELGAMDTIKWKKGTEPLPVELKEEKGMEEKYYRITMKNGREFSFIERKHNVKFEYGWLKVMSGYDYSEVVFAASEESVEHMVLSTLN